MRRAADLQEAVYHAVLLVVHMDPMLLLILLVLLVHTDRTHQVDRTYGSSSRSVQSGGRVLKLKLRKRHLVTSSPG